MKFGVLYEHQLPRPWDGDAELAVVQQSLEQVVLADRLGVDTAWAVEHHFLEEYAHCSAPEVFLAACAARTERIRLGHGIVLMPPAYNPPARVAERLAMLDLVSRGRVDWGVGESSSRLEARGLRHRPGRPPRHVAGGRRAGRRHAGDGALSWLSGPASRFRGRRPQAGAEAPPAALAGVLEPEHDPAGGPAGRGRAHVHVHRRRRGPAVGGRLPPDARPRVRADRPRGERAGRHADRSVLPSRRRGGPPARSRRLPLLPVRACALLRLRPAPAGPHRPLAAVRGRAGRARHGGAGRGHRLHRDAGGGRAHLEGLEAAGVDQAIFIQQSGRARHEDICDSLELFATAVLPPFREREAAGASARAAAPRAPRRGRARPQARRRPSPTTRSRPCRHTVCCRSTRRPSPRPTGAGWRSTGACGRSSTGPAECAARFHATRRRGRARPPR